MDDEIHSPKKLGGSGVRREALLVFQLFLLSALGFGVIPSPKAAELPNTATDLPLVSIRQFLDSAHGWGERTQVRVQGTVTHSISDKTFFIQDGDAGTYVFHKPAVAFRVGELVEVVGYPSLTTTPTLQRCRVRSLGRGTLPAAQPATAAEVRTGRYHMRLVSVQGVLTPDRLRGGHILVLKPGDGEQPFTADLEALVDLSPFDGLRPGSTLSVTGVCSLRRGPNNQPAGFNLFIRSPDDIVVLRPPPWWTPQRVWRVLGLVGVALGLTLAWVLTLRLQVRRQTARIRQMNEELEARVAQRTAELTEANRELEAFTHSVSHDLRAPLRHISGFAKIATLHPAVAGLPELQKPLNQIASSAARLNQLMDDLLAFSRVARQPLASRPVALQPLIAKIQQELQSETTDRRIEWRVAPLPEVYADPAALYVVWHNLLSNAVKYTQKQETAIIEITCQPSEHEWTFSVRDNGAGFDMRYADRLFGLFQRLHPDHEFAGSGIGLANVRRIIHRHGGRIWAEAEVNRGATFYFTLPRSAEVSSRLSQSRETCLEPSDTRSPRFSP